MLGVFKTLLYSSLLLWLHLSYHLWQLSSCCQLSPASTCFSWISCVRFLGSFQIRETYESPSLCCWIVYAVQSPQHSEAGSVEWTARVNLMGIAVADHLYVINILRCRISQFVKGSLPARARMWNILSMRLILALCLDWSLPSIVGCSNEELLALKNFRAKS